MCMPGIGLTPNLLHVGLLPIPSWFKGGGSGCTPPVLKPLGVKNDSAGILTLGDQWVVDLCWGCGFGGVLWATNAGAGARSGPGLGQINERSCKIQGVYVIIQNVAHA